MSNEQAVKAYVVSQFPSGITFDELGPDYDLLENGVIDSLGLLRLISWLDETFEVSFDDSNIAPSDFRSVRTICTLIKERSK